MPDMSESLIKSRITAALQALYVADALAMPVHWFYNTDDIYKRFPTGIRQFEDAPQKHPHDFLTLPATVNGKQIVGDVILKGKQKYWGVPHQHVHQGMKAGENTLNAHCARVVTRTLIENAGCYSSEQFLDNYIAFMTADTPLHPDTYAESYHRGFFTNLEKGLPRNQCGLAAGSTASVGGLVTIAPIVFSELLIDRSLARVKTICRTHLPDPSGRETCSYMRCLC